MSNDHSYDIEKVLEVLRDAELDKEDINIITNALETLEGATLNLMDHAQDHDPGDDDELGQQFNRIGQTLNKIRRAVDVAYWPPNRNDNKELLGLEENRNE